MSEQIEIVGPGGIVIPPEDAALWETGRAPRAWGKCCGDTCRRKKSRLRQERDLRYVPSLDAFVCSHCFREWWLNSFTNADKRSTRPNAQSARSYLFRRLSLYHSNLTELTRWCGILPKGEM